MSNNNIHYWKERSIKLEMDLLKMRYDTLSDELKQLGVSALSVCVEAGGDVGGLNELVNKLEIPYTVNKSDASASHNLYIAAPPLLTCLPVIAKAVDSSSKLPVGRTVFCFIEFDDDDMAEVCQIINSNGGVVFNDTEDAISYLNGLRNG